MEVIKGIPVAPGVAIGRAFVLDEVSERVPRAHVPTDRVEAELERLSQALEGALADLQADRDRAAEKLGPEPAKVFEFHIGLLQDRKLIDKVTGRIREHRFTAPYAVSETFRELADQFRALEGEVIRQKANDIIDLDRRLLRRLGGQSRDRLARLDEPVILVAHELTPAEAARLDVKLVQGFATDAGGRTSHTSIVAAALGIPVVVGGKTLTRHIEDGDQLILDGKSGVVVVRPDRETVEQYELDRERLVGARTHLEELARLEPVTRDGTRITLNGNIEFAHEIEALLHYGGDAVGLFRTEFAYLTSMTEPTEDELFENYRQSVQLLDGRMLTIRTVDLGADKHTQEQAEEPERNPFLGLRSIRYSLQNLPMFKRQLRAIVRATAFGPLKLMFPLVSTIMELRQAKMILHDVMEECDEEGIEFDRDVPVGVMIEVPSAALMASVFAPEVDFFSIGTNDLIQYTLAVDRGNERVASLYTAANPAVIQLVKAVIRAGKRFNIETSLCGEIAGEVTYTMLLIGLGLRNLSLVPSQIPRVKEVIRATDIEQCERLARKVGSLHSERQVLNSLREELRKILPETDGGWSAE
jgi:phosphotransferase system enzyme I (PtsI)